MNEKASPMFITVDDLLLEKASFIDRLNTYLREQYPPPAPQAKMSDNLKEYLDMLVDRLQLKARTSYLTRPK